jgi:hypothetical protein
MLSKFTHRLGKVLMIGFINHVNFTGAVSKVSLFAFYWLFPITVYSINKSLWGK